MIMTLASTRNDDRKTCARKLEIGILAFHRKNDVESRFEELSI